MPRQGHLLVGEADALGHAQTQQFGAAAGIDEAAVHAQGQGVVVGDGSDIGGGASIMGTLSGGGKQRVAIGSRALLGANSGVGISIGDDSVVEAGLYVTAGTKVNIVDEGAPRSVKASELNGVAGLLFRRNSATGAVEVLPRTGVGVTLNTQLQNL